MSRLFDYFLFGFVRIQGTKKIRQGKVCAAQPAIKFKWLFFISSFISQYFS